MKTSASGRAAIEQREGRRLSAYRDSRGIWTIGVGHAATGLPPVPHAGMTITEAECDALLAADLAPVETVINMAVTVPIGQNEFDALASLGFNIGVGGLRRSTVVKRLNLGDIAAAADAFMDWCKPAVLIARRRAERQQFLTADAPDGSGVSPTEVAVARAAALSGHAAHHTATSRTSALGGAVAVAAGSTAAVSAAAAGQSHWAWIIGAIFAAGALLDGAMSVVHARTATTLAANAAAQGKPAVPAA